MHPIFVLLATLVWFQSPTQPVKLHPWPPPPRDPNSRAEVALASPRFREAGVTYLALPLPYPIQKVELQRWCALLHLSEAQEAVLEALHQEYWEDYKTFGEKEIRPLWLKSAEYMACKDRTDDDECAGLMKAVFEQRRSVVQALSSRESRLMTLLEETLSEEQRNAMQRVRDDRIRSRFRHSFFVHPASAVDLTLLLHDAGVYADIPSDEFASVLGAYEHTLATLWQQFDQHQVNLLSRNSDLLRCLANAEPASLAYYRCKQAQESLWRRTGAIERRLVQTNRLYSSLLADLLPEGTAESFQVNSLQKMYPHVYPVVYDAAPILRSTFDLDIAEQLETQLRAILDEYEAARDAVCDRMERMVDDFTLDSASTSVSDPNAFDAYKI